MMVGPHASLALYNAAWTASLPAVLARLWWRGRREPAYRQGWAQRMGHWSVPPVSVGDGRRVWLHAVSLGETRAALPLVQALRAQWPGLQLVLTTGTATGFAAGLDLLMPGDLHGWVPLDTPAATRRFFAATQPDVGVLMETETWPNLLLQAEAAGVPMVLANARLSERSLAKGLRWPGLTRPMMGRLSAVCAQTERDAHHLEQAGVPAARIQVSGNLKYELHPSQDLLDRGGHWSGRAQGGASGLAPATSELTTPPLITPPPQARRRIGMAASGREGEDAPLLQAWCAQVGGRGNARALLLLVPRHPQRFDEVHAALAAAGLTVSRRSTWGPEGPAEADWQADAWLGDTVGEMPAYYAAADVALLGGSFAPLGGQNLIEAAACACPIVMGPHTFNFNEPSAQALEEGAAWRAADVAQALSLALNIDDHVLQQARSAGQAWVATHAGAAQRQAQAVAERLQSLSSGAKA